MSRRGEPLTQREIEHVARIRAAGGDVEECFDKDGRRSFRIVAADDNGSKVTLAGKVRIQGVEG